MKDPSEKVKDFFLFSTAVSLNCQHGVFSSVAFRMATVWTLGSHSYIPSCVHVARIDHFVQLGVHDARTQCNSDHAAVQLTQMLKD